MIQRNQGNIAFPITSSLTVNLTWPWYKGEAIFLHPAIVSDSRTVIINKHHFNQWIRSKMLESLLQAWPLFAFTFVLAGLSGVCIWCLVSSTYGWTIRYLKGGEVTKKYIRASGKKNSCSKI